MRYYVEVLGFALVANQGDRFIWVQCGESEVLLKPGAHHEPLPFEAAPCIVLYTDDLDAQRAALAARGVEMEQHGNCHHFQDPDGHWFQLVDPREDHSQ
jgi:catechol 2,3-dioxygenase-like lactoylglutathione lyase family enzyme